MIQGPPAVVHYYWGFIAANSDFSLPVYTFPRYVTATQYKLCGIRRRTSIPLRDGRYRPKKPDIRLREEMGVDIG